MRSAADIVAVIGDHTKLRKAGRSWKGSSVSQRAHAVVHGGPGQGPLPLLRLRVGGDVIHFVRQIDRLDFRSRRGARVALRRHHPRRERRGPRQERRDRLFEAIAAAQRLYAERLSRPGNAAEKYLDTRNVPAELRLSLGLGHAPDAWDTLAKTLSGAFPEDLRSRRGCSSLARRKGSYDRFRDRLLFVVKDEREGRSGSAAAHCRRRASPST